MIFSKFVGLAGCYMRTMCQRDYKVEMYSNFVSEVIVHMGSFFLVDRDPRHTWSEKLRTIDRVAKTLPEEPTLYSSTVY